MKSLLSHTVSRFLSTAYDAIEGNSGTIVVVADSYVDFEQELPNDKKISCSSCSGSAYTAYAEP